MFKSNRSKTVATLVGGAILGSAATVAVVFLLPFFSGDSAKDWRAGIPSNVLDTKSETTGKSIAVQRLEDILQFEKDFERRAALFGLLMSATEDGLIEYLDQSKEFDSPSIESAIIQKLASLNPQIAIDHVSTLPMSRQYDLVTAIFEEISLSNLDQARNLALALDQTLQQAALQGILRARHKYSDDLMLDIAKDLNQEIYAVSYLAKAVVFQPSKILR